jgi:predicted ABC-type ATPase
MSAMTRRHPCVVVLGGPNGAGKSTAAPALLRDALAVTEFVNADTIARGLSAFDPDAAAIAAGRVMLSRLDELERTRSDFAVETTLANRSLATRIERLRAAGYRVHVVFLWLPSAGAAVQRVRRRVRNGGHDVPSATVRRRFGRGLMNFFDLYAPVGDSWRLYDNSAATGPRLIAEATRGAETKVHDEDTWQVVRATLAKTRRAKA